MSGQASDSSFANRRVPGRAKERARANGHTGVRGGLAPTCGYYEVETKDEQHADARCAAIDRSNFLL